jgi:hypothetical protein
MALTPREMRKAILANLPEKTGKGLEEWLALLRAKGPKGKKERVAWLKAEHGLGHYQAHWVVEEAEGTADYAEDTSDDLIDAQFAGRKAGLRPVLDAVLAVARGLGPDVRVEPCKTYVPLIRRRQFAVVKAATATRVDLGLALPGYKPGGRLRAVSSALGGSGRITHVIPLSTPADVDDEVAGWVRRAYEADGPTRSGSRTGPRTRPGRRPGS